MVVLASMSRHDLWRSAHTRRSFPVVFEHPNLEATGEIFVSDAVFAVEACYWAERFGESHESLLFRNHCDFLAEQYLPAEDGEQ